MKYSKEPMFSVLISLNGSDADVLASVDSVLAQSYQDLELILLDREDKSSQRCDLLAVLDRAVESDVYMRVVGVDASLNGGAVKNSGMLQARGRLMAFLDAGDCWEPHFLEEIMVLKLMFPEAEAFSTAYQWQAESGRFVDPKIRFPSRLSGPSLIQDYFDSAAMGADPFVLSSFVGSKALFRQVGFFNATEEVGHERDLFCRAALYSTIAYSPSVLAFSRMDEQDSYDKSALASEWSAFISRIKGYAARENESRRKGSILRYTSAHLLDLASMHVKGRQTEVAKRFLADECCKKLQLRYIWWRFRCWLAN